MQSTQEIWKSIPGFYAYYEVSTLGRVRSLDRIVSCGLHIQTVKGKILTHHLDRDGYPRLGLRINGKQKLYRVNRLVALTFIDNPNNLPIVHHKDNIRNNNCVDNLEWTNDKGNIGYMMECGNFKGGKPKKKIDQFDLYGNFIKRWDFIEDVIRSGTARKPSEVAQGKRIQSGGFIWKWPEN